MVTLNTVFSASIHQHCSAFDVGIQEHFRILDRTVYVTFCCKVHYHIRLLFLKQFVYCLTVCNACLYKTEIRVIHYRLQCRQITSICQAVQAYDSIIRVLIQHVKYKVASNKSGSSGHDNSHNYNSPFI